MTGADFKWLFDFAKEIMDDPDAYQSCFDCDIFEKCQEENRDYCEKDQEVKQ